MTQNEKLLQAPRVAALLMAIDECEAHPEGGVPEIILKARAAFAPPVEMEYTMPSWEEVNPNLDAYLITKATYEALREQTRRPKPKMGREWWANEYSDGYIGLFHNTRTEAQLRTGGYTDIKTIRVREVLVCNSST